MSLLSLLSIWCKALVSVNSIVDVIISFKFCFVQIGNFCKVLGLSKYFVNHKLYLNLRLWFAAAASNVAELLKVISQLCAQCLSITGVFMNWLCDLIERFDRTLRLINISSIN